ncbi:MAG: ammonium transporter, partial [Acidobacteriota bacterium]
GAGGLAAVGLDRRATWAFHALVEGAVLCYRFSGYADFVRFDRASLSVATPTSPFGLITVASVLPRGAGLFWDGPTRVTISGAGFAGTAATIVSGAVAERMRFTAYLAYSFLITAFVYPVVGHWVWGGGWLASLDFHDFAGSTVVHGVGGVSALIAAWMLGPRFGRFNDNGTANVIGGHSLPLVALGTFILWFGWYGFNAGSTLGMGEPQVVARVAMTTTLAPAAAAIVAMCVAWARYGKPDLSLALNGALAGLVGITAPCAVVSPGASIFIGIVAGFLVVFGIEWLNRIRIDDVVGAFPVHGLCGAWGTVAVGLFGQGALGAPADGLFYGGGFGQLGIQCLGVIACFAFAAVAMGIVFKTIDAVVGLRVSHETELVGLDIEEHGLESYSGFQIFTTE